MEIRQENIAALTFCADRLPVDFKDPGKCQLAGVFRQLLAFEGRERSFLMYIPQKAHYNRPCIIAACPDKAKPWEFLERSGLRTLADEEELFICLPEPIEGVWDAGGRDADFIGCVYQKIQERDYYVLMQDCIYAMGFGEGATVMQQAAMKMTSEWSGMATFGNLLPEVMINEEISLNTSSVETDTGAAGGEFAVTGNKCQLPVWIFYKEPDGITEKVCQYWIQQNKNQTDCVYGKQNTRIYLPPVLKAGSRANDDSVSQTRVTEGYNAEENPPNIKKVWRYLSSFRRHRGYEGKFLRHYRQPEKNGAVKRTMEIDGIHREWYEYIPQRLADSQEAIPLVVVLHGRGGDGETFFDITDMSVVAEEREFAAVFPTADFYQMKEHGLKSVRLWNGNFEGKAIDSLPFIRSMAEDVCSRLPIDRKKIYVCGQSSGGYMALCCAMAAPELFAAAVSWSGYCCFDGTMPIFTYRYDKYFQTGKIPICLMFGAQDALFGISSLHPFPERKEPALTFIRFLIRQFGLEQEPMVYTCHPVTYYVWHTPEGFPALKVGIVANMSHANYPEESRIAYDEWFSWFSKGEDGKCLYMGRPFLR